LIRRACYFVPGALRTVAFYVVISALALLVPGVGFFDARRRLLHDLALGTVVINSGRATALGAARTR
jgi:uncharacterized RDD family membrane protein YckC